MACLYLGCPAQTYDGDPASLLLLWQERVAGVQGWSVRCKYYGHDCSLSAQDFSSMVMQAPGPVLLLEPIQAKSRQEIIRRLGGRLPVAVAQVASLDELEAAIDAVVAAYEMGEPRVSLDVAVALLLMRKLERLNMWAGNAKGYMWTDDLPKGRGFDEKYACRLGVVLSVLLQDDLLTFKTSKGKRKYALNPERREDIHEILRTRRFSEKAETSLLRNAALESVRVLDFEEADE